LSNVSCIGPSAFTSAAEGIPTALIELQAVILLGNVAFGSRADMAAGSRDVRFTPESGHRAVRN
jgi:hypothetical protein